MLTACLPALAGAPARDACSSKLARPVRGMLARHAVRASDLLIRPSGRRPDVGGLYAGFSSRCAAAPTCALMP